MRSEVNGLRAELDRYEYQQPQQQNQRRSRVSWGEEEE